MEMITVRFDKGCFSGEAVKRACMELGDLYDFNIYTEPNEIVVALNKSKDGVREEDITKLRSSLLSHQIRVDTEDRFKTIRELIVAQAFAPCDNLHEIIEKMNI